MRNKGIIACRFFLLMVLLTVTGTAAWAQEKAEEERAPAGVITWDKYGLSFQLPDDASVEVSTDVRSYMCTKDLCVDINIIDRRMVSDEEIGRIIISCAEEGGMDLSTAHGACIDNESLQGGFIHTPLENDSEEITIIAGFEDIKSLYAFVVIIQSAPGTGEKAMELLKSFNVKSPE